MLRLKIILGLATVALLTTVAVIHYIRDSGRNEVRLENLNQQVETRTRIDESIRTAPRDVDAALRLLRERQDR